MEDTPENREALGRRIAEARIAAGYTNQSEFCRRMGTNPPTLNRWERGKMAPEIWNLHEIAVLCRVSMEWLMTGEVGARSDSYRRWRSGKTVSPEAIAFIESVPIGGYQDDELFYDLLLLAWQRGLSRDEAAIAAKTTSTLKKRRH